MPTFDADQNSAVVRYPSAVDVAGDVADVRVAVCVDDVANGQRCVLYD